MLGKRDGGLCCSAREFVNRLVDGHRLCAADYALQGGEVCVLAGNQHFASEFLFFERLYNSASRAVI